MNRVRREGAGTRTPAQLVGVLYLLCAPHMSSRPLLLTSDFFLGIPHSFIPATGSSSPEKDYEAFKNLVTSPGSGDSNPIPIVLAGPSPSSQSEVTEIMDKWTSIARAGATKAPFLWIGPTAASQKSSGFSMGQELEKNAKDQQDAFFTNSEARSRGMEVLGMYNATLKASSWDGHSYGERVSLVQAMMVSRFPFPRMS